MTIGDAAMHAGVEAWRLRSWERAGLLTPQRSPSGYRLYSAGDLEKIAALKTRSESGRRLVFYAGKSLDSPASEPEAHPDALITATSTGGAGPDPADPQPPSAWSGDQADTVDIDKRIRRRLATAVAHADDSNAVYLELLDCALEVVGATAGAVSFVNPSRQQYFLVAHRGLSDRYVLGIAAWKLHEGLAGKAYGLREPQVVTDLRTHNGVAREIVRLEGLRAYACVPLVRGPRCFGLLEIMRRDGQDFTYGHLEWLETIVTTLSLVAESAMLGAELVALRDERLRVFRDWADQAVAASEAERAKVLDAVNAEVATLGQAIAEDPTSESALSETYERLDALALDLASADRSWVDLVPAVRDQLIPMIREESGKRIEFGSGASSTQLPLSTTNRLYVALSTILHDAAQAARSRVETVIYNDDRGLVIEVADDRAGSVSVDAVAGLPREVENMLRSMGVVSSQGVRIGYSCVLSLVMKASRYETGEVKLTEREWRILHQLSSGQSNRELANEFGISQKTVQNHLTSIYRKIGVASRGQAVRYALSSPRAPHREETGSGTGPRRAP